MSDIKPDLVQAESFLAALDPDRQVFRYLAYHEAKGDTRAEQRHGAIRPIWRHLVQLNQQGFGISVAVNEFGNKPRRNDNATRIRAVWQEDDDGYEGAYPLIPSLVVETSPGRYHRYWLVEGDWPSTSGTQEGYAGQSDFRRVMDAMVKNFGSDPQAKDLARVLRLPGTLHRKNEPHLVRIIYPKPDQPIARYTYKQIVTSFVGHMVGSPQSAPTKAEMVSPPRLTDDDRIRDALSFIPSEGRDEWLTAGLAIHHHCDGSQDGFVMWDEWSQTTNANNYDKADQHRAWKSFGESRVATTTIASLFDLAIAHGWKDKNRTSLPHPTGHSEIRLDGTGHESELANRTIKAVKRRFSEYGTVSPSTAEWDGLEQIANCIEAMATQGDIGSSNPLIILSPSVYVSSLAPGTGKTTVIEEAIRELCANGDYQDVGALIFVSRLEEIRTFVANCNLKDADFSVIVAQGKAENDLGWQDDKTEARIMFTTQEGLRTRALGGKPFVEMDRLFYRGKPRNVRVWDEALLQTKSLLVDRNSISDLLKPFREAGHQGLADDIEEIFRELKDAPENATISLPAFDRHGKFKTFEKLLSGPRQVAFETLWQMGGRSVRVRQGKYQGNVLVDYEDVLPQDLTPLLVLDASGQIRQSYTYWQEYRKGLEFLPGPSKQYDGLTIHHWDRAAGRDAVKKDAEVIAEGVAKTINRDVPKGEPVLVVHFQQNADGIKSSIGKLVDTGHDVRFLNWGRHTATNEFKDCRHVFLIGVLQYSVPQFEAEARGAMGLKVSEDLSKIDYDNIRLGEIAHHIFQAACRGHIRHSHSGSCPTGCHVYVICSTHPTNGIPREMFSQVFPEANVDDWVPIKELTPRQKVLAQRLETVWGSVKKADLANDLGYSRTDHLRRQFADGMIEAHLRNAGMQMTIEHRDITVLPLPRLASNSATDDGEGEEKSNTLINHPEPA